MAFRLRMPAQIGDWLAELRATEPVAAAEVGAAIVALVEAAELPGPPLVTDPSVPVPADPRETLDETYQDLLERLQRIRRGVADIATERRRTELRLDALRAKPDHDPADLAALERELAEAQQREEELTKRSQVLQMQVDAFRTRKETIKASYTAAEAQARVSDALAELDRVFAQADRIWPEASPERPDSGTPADEDEHEAGPDQPTRESDADQNDSVSSTIRRYTVPTTQPASQHDVPGPASSASGVGAGSADRDRLGAPGAARRSRSDAAADLRELNADPLGADVRILFAVEPESTVTLLTLLEGTEAIRDSLDEAIHLAGQLLDEVRAENSAPATQEADDDWLEFAGTAPFVQRFFADSGGAVAERAAALAAGQSLAHLRERRGPSLPDVARASGIGQWRLSMIEQDGLRSADVNELAAYVRALGGRLELTASFDGERTNLA